MHILSSFYENRYVSLTLLCLILYSCAEPYSYSRAPSESISAIDSVDLMDTASDEPLPTQDLSHRPVSESDMINDDPIPMEDPIPVHEGSTVDPSETSDDSTSTAQSRFEAGPAPLPRLTEQQYQRTLTAIFGDNLPFIPLEPDTNPYLFYSIGASTTTVSEFGVERYAQSADLLATTIVNDRSIIESTLGCWPRDLRSACVEQFIRHFGLLLFRRPLTDEEVNRRLEILESIPDDAVETGIELLLSEFLQSPSFLYIFTEGEPDPQDPTQFRYRSIEMASKLSFMFLNRGPSLALLLTGLSGTLSSTDGILQSARLLLQEPEAREAIQEFFVQYLDLRRLEEIDLDTTRYPEFTPQLIESMQQEVRLLVDDLVFRRDEDIRLLFSDAKGYVNRSLATLYGVSDLVPDATEGLFVPIDFPPEIPRKGLLTLGAFLTMNAHPTDTSPTLRGKYIRERLFCQSVPPPPDEVDVSLPEVNEEQRTLRERLEQHRNDPACSGCHSFIDPPGMLFEHYDSLGRYRNTSEGLPIDASSTLNGIDLNNALEFASILAVDPLLTRCLVKQYYRYASQRLELPSESASLTRIEQRFADTGYRFKALPLAVAISDGFRRFKPSLEDQ